ncbi:MAG: prolyl oligopeptidase family serine peptidase [Pseudomonadota bacterium]|nr:prolyl oligopeptidase family serine peptidase [Pseudomonadota bacterium]MDQ3160841.1 prolyl oligopeptidase family serine peptidase [Pseudomonadota bacterium]
MIRALLATLVLTLALPLHAIASEPPAAQATFLSQTDCFEDTPDYESWLKSIPPSINGQQPPTTLVEKLVPIKAFEFARSGFDCRVVTYASDGQTVAGYLVQPKSDAAVGKLPLLVFNRGGNGDFGRIDPLQLFRKLLPLAKAGYVVVASQYRDADEFGGKDVGDVMRLIDLSISLPSVDASRIFLLGESRGGMMGYLVARKRTDITAMASVGGPTDLLAGLDWRPEMERVYGARIPGYETKKRVALEARSALKWAEELPATMPVLVLHGEADDRVNVEDARAMAARLQQLGRPHKLIVYPGDSHGLENNKRVAHMEILNWFKSAP